MFRACRTLFLQSRPGVRHRSFNRINRSSPVTFQPHNVITQLQRVLLRLTIRRVNGAEPGDGARPLAAASRGGVARGPGCGGASADWSREDSDLRAVVEPGQAPRSGDLHRAYPG